MNSSYQIYSFWNSKAVQVSSRRTHHFSTLSISFNLPRKKQLFSSVLQTDFRWFLCQCKVSLFQEKLQSKKRHHMGKFRKNVWFLSLRQASETREEKWCSLQLIHVRLLPVISNFFENGAFCYGRCFCVQPAFFYTINNEAGDSKVSGQRKLSVLDWPLGTLMKSSSPKQTPK